MALRDRVLYQLSDLPWLIVGGAIGLTLEAVAHFTGLAPYQWLGWLWVKVVLGYGFGLGYAAFVARRLWLRAPLGLVLGVVATSVSAFVGAREPAPSPAWIAAELAVWAALPTVIDAIVDPAVLRTPLGWFASHHPRYARVRPGSDQPSKS